MNLGKHMMEERFKLIELGSLYQQDKVMIINHQDGNCHDGIENT